MKKYLTLDSILVSNQLVGIRVDINSAIINSKVEDNLRITNTCENIQELLDKGAKVLIFAHQGRKGKSDFTSLKLHKEILEKHLNQEIIFIEEISKQATENTLKEHKDLNIFLLENLRELDCEQKPELSVKGLVKKNPITQIIELCNYYVLDAFSIAHRPHSSVIGSSKVIQVAGRLLQKELKPLSILDDLEHPKVYVMGGSKADDLVPLIQVSLENNLVDYVLLSGVIGELALHSLGYELGKKWKWIVEHEYHKIEKDLKKLLKKYRNKFILPSDIAYVNDKGKRVELAIENLKKGNLELEKYIIEDVGSSTIENFMNIINTSKSCYIKGPQGNFEKKGCEFGTFELFKQVSKSSTFSFMGGGHSVTAAQLSKTIDDFSYVSLAGGALVQYIEGKTLPGVKALEESYSRYIKLQDLQYDVVVVGSNVIDTFVNSPLSFSSKNLGSKIKVEDNFENRVGGGGIHVSAHLSKLKAKVGLISRFSKESIHQIINCSKQFDFQLLSKKTHNEACAKSILIQTPDNDRVLYTYRGQNQNLSIEDIPKNLPISNYYFSGLTNTAFNTQLQIVKKLRDKQPYSLFCYNPSLYTIKLHGEEIIHLLEDIDVLIFNDEEAQALTHDNGVEHNLRLLSTMGPKIIVITCGSKGAHAIDCKTGKMYYRHAQLHPHIVDTTGAGDCFAATFFYFISKKYSIPQSLEYASINASGLIQEVGSLNGSLSLEELKSKKYF